MVMLIMTPEYTNLEIQTHRGLCTNKAADTSPSIPHAGADFVRRLHGFDGDDVRSL